MQALVGWRRERRAFGCIRCIPPEGAEHGEIVIHERVRPLAPLRALLAEHGLPKGAPESTIQLATAEGELAAVVQFQFADQHYYLGVIYGDDFQTVVKGRTARPDQRERIRAATHEIVLHLPLGLGHPRHRRFFYRPPIGWQGLPRGLVTDWFPPGYPGEPTTIKVLPARPINARLQLDSLLRDDNFSGLPIDEVSSSSLQLDSFKATVGVVRSAERVLITTALEDAQYLYVLRLSTSVARRAVDEPLFQKLVESCVPLPAPVSDVRLANEALAYWAT